MIAGINVTTHPFYKWHLPAFVQRRLSSYFSPHNPVMKTEIIQLLDPKSGQTFLDMTFGTGGHANEIMCAAKSDLVCYFLDRDPNSLPHMQRLNEFHLNSGHKTTPLIGKFSDLPQIQTSLNLKSESIDLILMDLGVSSFQLDSKSRGFSIRNDGPLDMRMNQTESNTPTAADLVNNLNSSELEQIFSIYGEERFSRRIADAIVDRRTDLGKFETTGDLAQLISCVIPKFYKNNESKLIHPATRIFQALRIFVNDELNELCIGLAVAYKLLKVKGVFVALSFHALEDRLIKWAFKLSKMDTLSGDINSLPQYLERRSNNLQYFREAERQNYLLSNLSYVTQLTRTTKEVSDVYWDMITGPLTPSDSEVESNPRSRSAKLRCARKSSQ